MKNHIMCVLWMGLCLAILCSGCGPKLPSDLPKLYPAELTVIQDGKPLPGALITLTNVEAGVKWGCVAKTDAEGKAAMKTQGLYEGAPAGTYKATVVKQEFAETNDPYAGAPDPKVDEKAYVEWVMANEERINAMRRRAVLVYNLIDPQYSMMDQTTLEITVSEEKNEHTLDVGKAVRVISQEKPR